MAQTSPPGSPSGYRHIQLPLDFLARDTSASAMRPMGSWMAPSASMLSDEGNAMMSSRSELQPLAPKDTSKPLLNGILREETPADPRALSHLKHLTILPGSATGRWWLEFWDLYMSFLVFALAYFEPFALALYHPGDEPWVHAVINYTFNLSFTLDRVLQFFISTQHSQDSIHKDLWERDVRRLAEAYCAFPFSQEGRQGWFWLDLVTIVPGWYTTLLVDPCLANPMYFLRIFRLFQTARLARLEKLTEILHANYGFPFFVVEVCKFVVITTLTCHWMACVWVLIEGKVTAGVISYSTDQESWLSALIKAKGDSCVPDAANDPLCVFMLAYYWAAMTLTSVGYGDITPQNKMEYCISVICMFVVGYIWAFIVGTIVSVLSNLDPGSVAFKRSLDDLGKLMRRRGLSQSLQVRLRTYMHETRHFMQLYDQRQLVEQYFSDGLQREIAAHSAEVRGMLKNVYWMRELQEEAILDIVRGLRPRAYGPNEHILLRRSMILMQRGQNDILMETPQLIDSSMPRTLSFVELLMLTRNTLIEVGHCYPRADRRLRRAQVRTATARAFIYQADRIRASQKASMKSRTRSTASMAGGPPKRHSTGNESSFANPGLARIQFHCDSDSTKEVDVKPLLMELLHRQTLLQMEVSKLASEVRCIHEGGSGNGKKNVLGKVGNQASRALHYVGYRNSGSAQTLDEARDVHIPEGLEGDHNELSHTSWMRGRSPGKMQQGESSGAN